MVKHGALVQSFPAAEGSDAAVIGVHAVGWGMLKNLWPDLSEAEPQRHRAITPLGRMERPFSCWHRIKPLCLQAPEKLHAKPQRAPNAQQPSQKSPAPPLLGLFLPSLSEQPQFPNLKLLCSPPAPTPVFPARRASTHYKLENKTRYHHKYDNFIKIYI